ncbi:unnamed protein product [Phytophthora fragariaefolia]|uniref:Unnamed protein product n=1 Tax=Phytophthora fragariaefolia TaxID=1490495 RepID=A0A9W6XB19_9STRA|nr:unnamed protein product [Phytophthora fragariaefolia]
MRKLPSSASAGNLRQPQLAPVDPASAFQHNTTRSSMPITPSLVATASLSAGSPNVATTSACEMATQNTDSTIANSATSGEGKALQRSLAYRHTKSFEMKQDDFGKQYERRVCRHCDAIFSFRGGTTSSILRHLKSVHGIIKRRASSERQEDDQDSTTLSVNSLNSRNGVRPTPELAATPSASSDPGPDAAQHEIATRSGDCIDDSDPDEDDSLAAIDTELPTYQNQTLKRKRDDDDCSLTGSSRSGGEDLKAPRGGYTLKFTSSQTAIIHILRNYAKELPLPAMRLRLAKHLTHNACEAEMYNVLDPGTQLEYIREFVRTST